ncbi:copper resistance protein B [Rhodanobacter sp. DHG33]|uniref:copper resistance protein B n=1 Tax=Rhodanobacter sp. DHG33 TaxID=2775921 RepID=UPI00177D9F95|nr:copper resistance protein B [Rhodanobacter sp. DHG33]MBD8900062.1 copper resistance protein B [Rhodanobacter sp. DHG33]
MSAFIRNTLACMALALSTMAWAQQTDPAPASSTGMAMDMGGMAMPGTPQGSAQPAKPAMQTRQAEPASASSTATDMGGMDMSSMPGMDHASHAGDTMPAMSHGQAHDMGAMPGMRMQGGAPPPDARSADYSDNNSYNAMPGMDMRDAEPLGMLRFDQLEAFDGLHGNGQSWEMEGWYGTDTDKLWLRSEGQHGDGRFDDSDIEALWSHAVAPFWNTQLGVRNDFGDGSARQWLAFGVQGLAPYWFELEATAYAGSSGRTAARLRADYELLITQRLILQPEFEANFYGKDDPQRRLGSGLSDADFGLRLRYEIRRQFAPYVGVVWTRRFGGTAAFARDEGRPVFDRQLVAGLRIWF